MQKVMRGRPDFILLLLTMMLVGFGLVMVFSASSSVSAMKFHNAWYFAQRQAYWAAAGTVALFIFMNIHHSHFRKWFLPIFAVSVILLVLVVLVGTSINGHKSWFGVGSFGIQPTELAKLSLILYLSVLIDKKRERMRSFRKGLLPVIVIVGFVLILVMLQPDVGSTMILFLSSAIVIIIGGANLLHLAGIALCVSPVFVYMLSSHSYRVDRFSAFLDPWADPQGVSYQLVQSLFAFSQGGVTGAGLGKSILKYLYLPEAHNDFIFSIIGEEMGFIGTTAFLIVYLLFLWRGLIVSLRCEDGFGKLFGVGFISLIGVQALINLGGVTGSIPMTGVTLPFISYGGSSLLLCMTGVGMVLSISREKTGAVSKKSN